MKSSKVFIAANLDIDPEGAMVDLRRTPSIQHAVALIGKTVEGTIKNFEQLEASGSRPSLAVGRKLIKPLMEGKSLEWAIAQCKHLRKRDRQANINLVAAFAQYAQKKSLTWFRPYPAEPYPIGPGIYMPINPYGFWAEDSILHLLWVQSWTGRTLDQLQKAIFNTVLEQRVFVGDFKTAKLEWVDLREQERGCGRAQEVLGREDLGRLSNAELKNYLDILFVAFRQYSDARRARKAAEKTSTELPALPLFQ
jgi:hypothetical protein